MINSLYPGFRRWSSIGSVWILSDTHFDDDDCKLMDENWITPEEQIKIINNKVSKNDTFIHLGDVGNPGWIKEIKAYKILIMGNHDQSITQFDPYFDEIYSGPLFIGEKILLSHEPINGITFALNIHGHDHSKWNGEDKYHLNLAANVCNYTPVSLGKIIKKGALSQIDSIHRLAIDKQKNRVITNEEL